MLNFSRLDLIYSECKTNILHTVPYYMYTCMYTCICSVGLLSFTALEEVKLGQTKKKTTQEILSREYQTEPLYWHRHKPASQCFRGLFTTPDFSPFSRTFVLGGGGDFVTEGKKGVTRSRLEEVFLLPHCRHQRSSFFSLSCFYPVVV